MSTPRGLGAEVGLTYDTTEEAELEPGEYLRTGTGRSYVIASARRSGRPRPPWRSRWRVRAVVVRPEEVPDDAVVYPVRWHPRTRSRGRPTGPRRGSTVQL